MKFWRALTSAMQKLIEPGSSASKGAAPAAAATPDGAAAATGSSLGVSRSRRGAAVIRQPVAVKQS